MIKLTSYPDGLPFYIKASAIEAVIALPALKWTSTTDGEDHEESPRTKLIHHGAYDLVRESADEIMVMIEKAKQS